MECTSEDTENVTIFLQNFLAILHKVKKDPNYMWKPCMIMADEMVLIKGLWVMSSVKT